MTRISVIIPTYKSSFTLHRCLTSVTRAVRTADEIIVVADGCIVDDIAIASEFDVQILTIPEQSGPSRARNLGVESAQGDILFFMDSDVTIPIDSLERIDRIFSENPELAAVIGSYDDEPAEQNFLSQYRNLLHHYVHQMSASTAQTFWGACGAIRRDVFIAQGGFDHNFRLPSVEDIELGYRLIAADHKIYLDKELQVKHLKRWDAKLLVHTDVFRRAIPWTLLILKDNKLINDLNLDTNSRFSTLIVGICLVCLAFSYEQWPLLFVAAICLMLLVLLNRNLYRFLLAKRGILFTVLVLPWHWLYYLYSGLAFFGTAVHFYLGELGKRMGQLNTRNQDWRESH